MSYYDTSLILKRIDDLELKLESLMIKIDDLMIRTEEKVKDEYMTEEEQEEVIHTQKRPRIRIKKGIGNP